MNLPEADSTLRAVFAPFQHVQLSDDLRESWYDVALQDCDYMTGMRIARALAATCDYPPVPKQFIEMRRAALLPERVSKALPAGEPEQTDNGRVWAKHCAAAMRAVGRQGVQPDGHTPISGDSWASCPACRAYSKELAMQSGTTGTEGDF